MRSSIIVALLFSLPITAFGQNGPFPSMLKLGTKEDQALAKGAPTKGTDLRCHESHSYIGGIDRHWGILISGPPRNRVHYKFIQFRTHEFRGTYQVKNGLAFFSGKQTVGPMIFQQGKPKQKPQITSKMFALNYKHINKKTHFNLLIRDGKGNYRYKRQWFRSDDKGGWELEQELDLTFTPVKQTKKELVFEVTGSQSRWTDKDKRQVREIQEGLSFVNRENKFWYRNNANPAWAPHVLRPSEGDTTKMPIGFHLGISHFGWVRGFDLSEPPKW